MPDIAVQIDWDNDGTYGEVGEDVTARVRGTVSVMYGRDQETALAPTISGRGSLTLDNRSRDYSPRNTASPIYGKVRPGRPVTITRTVGSNTYTLFDGNTDDTPINPEIDSLTVSLSLVDQIANFSGQTITTDLYQGVRTGDAIGYVLDACGWPADARDLDPGATVIPWWWEDNADAASALERIIRSEGPPSQLYVGPNREIVYRDRHSRLTRSASLTSQGTWTSLPGPLAMARGFTYNEAWSNIVNSATATVDVRQAQQLQAVWTSDTTITLSPGEQKMITVSTPDPFYDAVVPEDGVDFVTTIGAVTTSLTRTSGASTAIILTSAGTAAVITGLRLRACPVTVSHSVQVSASDSDSIADYGSRSLPGTLDWCGPGDAEAICSTVVAQRAQPLPIVSASFILDSSAKADAILARDLSDRVVITEPETALNDPFYIESIAHEFSTAGGPRFADHRVTFGLEAAPPVQGNVFRFDTAGAGFNDGLFGSGIDDPATMFRFDGVAGTRFDEGVFAT